MRKYEENVKVPSSPSYTCSLKANEEMSVDERSLRPNNEELSLRRSKVNDIDWYMYIHYKIVDVDEK